MGAICEFAGWEPDLPARFAVKTLHRGLVFSDQRHNDLPGVGHLGLFYNYVITVEECDRRAWIRRALAKRMCSVRGRNQPARLFRGPLPLPRAVRPRCVPPAQFHYVAIEQLLAYGLGELHDFD